MSKIDLLEDVAPSSNEIGAVADMAQRVLDLEDEINRLEDALKQKKQDLKVLAEQDLAELMQELNIKDFTLSNGAKVEIKDVIQASVPSQGSIDRAKTEDQRVELQMLQQQCFEWLRAQGAGDIIKSNVEVQFGRMKMTHAMLSLTSCASVKFITSELWAFTHRPSTASSKNG